MVLYSFEEEPGGTIRHRAAPHAGARFSLASKVGSGLPEKFNSPRGTIVHTKPVRVEGHGSRLKKVADNSNTKGAAFATRGLGRNKEVKAPHDPPDHVRGNNRTERRTPPQRKQKYGGPLQRDPSQDRWREQAARRVHRKAAEDFDSKKPSRGKHKDSLETSKSGGSLGL